MMPFVVGHVCQTPQGHGDAHAVPHLSEHRQRLPELPPRGIEVPDHAVDHRQAAERLAQLPSGSLLARISIAARTCLDGAGGIAPNHFKETEAAPELRREDAVTGLLGGGQAFAEDRLGTLRSRSR